MYLFKELALSGETGWISCKTPAAFLNAVNQDFMCMNCPQVST